MLYLMKCGHINNATTNDGKPACAICTCVEVEHECEGNKGLEGRKAKCSYCEKMEDSSWSKPFFEYQPNKEYDYFYCGCRGWD